MDRLAYTLRRLAQLVPVAFGVTFLTFLLVHLIPGDPALTVLGVRATPQLVAQLHQQWGLDRSLPEQYWLFLKRLAHGDLGDSLLYRVARALAGRRAHARDALAARLRDGAGGRDRGAARGARRAPQGRPRDQVVRAVPSSASACRRSGSGSC